MGACGDCAARTEGWLANSAMRVNPAAGSVLEGRLFVYRERDKCHPREID